MKKSPYTLVHALIAAAVLLFAVSKNFWHTFLHGLGPFIPPAQQVVQGILGQVVLFGGLALVLFLSACFATWRTRRRAAAEDASDARAPYGVLRALRFAVCAFPFICVATFLIEIASQKLLEWGFGLTFPQQTMIDMLKPGTYPQGVRLLLMATALFEAPLLEEPLFRGIMFRGFTRAMPVGWAMALSGFLFAVVHVNAATFVPLWFLGVVFAALYARTGSLLAPITVHFLFNLTNLLLLLFFPELAS